MVTADSKRLLAVVVIFIMSELNSILPLRIIQPDGTLERNISRVSFAKHRQASAKYKQEYRNEKQTTSGMDVNLSTFMVGLYEQIQERMTPIYPGTQWCGSGSLVRFRPDLGLFFLTDNCCKEHDHCPKTIPTGEEKFGLKNTGLFTRSHCSCEQTFFNCLKRANTVISNKIGYTYFNLLQPQCFREEHPVIGCMKKQSETCLSYIIDEALNKTWQWFDNKIY